MTCATWSDTWLNEGFASWSETHWWERRYGSEAYRRYMTGTQRVMDPNGPLYDHEQWFDVKTTYNKGAWKFVLIRSRQQQGISQCP